MDSSRFDTLTRLLSSGRSRRELAPLLSGLAVGGAFTPLLGLVEADAKKRKKKKKACPPCKKRKKGKCKGTLPDGTGCSGGTCQGGSCVAAAPSPPPPPPLCVCASGCPFAEVQAAVDAASPGATITICAGTYFGRIAIDKDLTLIGVGDGDNPAVDTIFDVAGVGQAVVRIRPGRTVELQDLRITGGNAGNIAGGIENAGTLTLTACTVSGNFAANLGGGIVNGGDSTLTLFGSSVTGNHAGGDGGGIYNLGTVACGGGSTVSGNTVGNPPVASDCIDVSGGSGCATCPA